MAYFAGKVNIAANGYINLFSGNEGTGKYTVVIGNAGNGNVFLTTNDTATDGYWLNSVNASSNVVFEWDSSVPLYAYSNEVNYVRYMLTPAKGATLTVDC